jgi:hypothetical protein
MTKRNPLPRTAGAPPQFDDVLPAPFPLAERYPGIAMLAAERLLTNRQCALEK